MFQNRIGSIEMMMMMMLMFLLLLFVDVVFDSSVKMWQLKWTAHKSRKISSTMLADNENKNIGRYSSAEMKIIWYIYCSFLLIVWISPSGILQANFHGIYKARAHKIHVRLSCTFAIFLYFYFRLKSKMCLRYTKLHDFLYPRVSSPTKSSSENDLELQKNFVCMP